MFDTDLHLPVHILYIKTQLNESSAPAIQGSNPKHNMYAFFIYIVVQIMYLSFQLECGKNGNKQKEARIGPLKNTSRGKCGTEIPPQVFQELKYNIIICLTLQ